MICDIFLRNSLKSEMMQKDLQVEHNDCNAADHTIVKAIFFDWLKEAIVWYFMY